MKINCKNCASLIGLTISLMSTAASAKPIYLLMEGTITSSQEISSNGDKTHYEIDYGVGRPLKIQAAWDDAIMFGRDTDPAVNKAIYESWGYIRADGTFYSLANSQQSLPSTAVLPTYSVSFDGWLQNYQMGTPSLNTGSDLAAWAITLKTEHGSESDFISLDVSGYQQGSGIDAASSFGLNLTDLSHSSLDSQLLGFNWSFDNGDIALGGTYEHRGSTMSNSRGIAWTRAVLSYNPEDADAAPVVPVPSSMWLLISATLAMFAGSRVTSRRSLTNS